MKRYIRLSCLTLALMPILSPAVFAEEVVELSEPLKRMKVPFLVGEGIHDMETLAALLLAVRLHFCRI